MVVAAPIWLVAALLAAAGLAWIALRNGWGVSRAAIAAASGLLCAAAPAGIALQSAAGPVRVVAIDDSGSMRNSAPEVVQRLAPQLAAGGARLGVVRFAGEAVVERTPGTAPLQLKSAPGGVVTRTDPAAALRRAAELLPAAGGEVVLLTDGRVPQHLLAELAAAGRALRARGGRLSVVPAGPPPGEDAAAWALRAPASAAPGSTVRLGVTVRLSRSGTAHMLLSRDGTVIKEGALTGRPGELRRMVIDDRPPNVRGAAQYRLQASAGTSAAQPDAIPQNGVRDVLVTIGTERVVWLCSEQRSVESALNLVRAAGGTLELRRPSEMPADSGAFAGVAAVILWDADVNRFARGALDALARYVEEGGGLLQLGGPGTFGLAGFGGDPLERVSAVKADPRSERPLALALVLDASGSMAEPVTAGDPAAGSKMDAARSAVESALEQLRPQDRLYIVPFREGALTPIELTAGGANNAAALRDALTARGGTHVRPAIEQAAAWLEQAPQEARQMVVITDGLDPRLSAGGADREAVLVLLQRLQRAQIGGSLLTSEQQSGIGELIAAVNGRVGWLMQFSGVEELLGRELRLSRGSLEWTGDAVPQPVTPFEAIALPRELLRVQRANRTALNEGAIALLRLPGAEPVPLLAVRQATRGRAAAFTSTFSAPWAKGWMDPGAAAVVANALSYVLAEDRATDVALRASVRTDTVRVSAQWIGSAPGDGRTLDLVQQDVRVPFEPTGPGRYAATIGLAADARLATVVERTEGGARPLGRIALPGGWAAEWEGAGIDLEGCHRLAAAAGGVAVDDALLWRPYPLPGEAPRPIGTWLLLAGLLGLLALFGKRRG